MEELLVDKLLINNLFKPFEGCKLQGKKIFFNC